MPNDNVHEVHNLNYEENINQQRIPSGQGLIGASAYHKDIPFKEVVGTNNANGTELARYALPAGYVFCASLIQYSSNEGRSIAVCTLTTTQALGHASQAEVFIFGSDNKGLHAINKEQEPIFVVNNSAGTAALDIVVYAPHTVFGSATNDVATSYFQGHLTGLVYKGSVAVRGTS